MKIRPERVGHLLQKEIAEILAHQLRDPRVSHWVSVTGVVQHLVEFLVRELVARLEALLRVPVAQLPLHRHDGGVAMHARTRLRLGLTLRLFLVRKHVGMAAAVAVIDREGIAEEHFFQPRITLYLLVRHCLAAAMPAESRAGRQCGFLI